MKLSDTIAEIELDKDGCIVAVKGRCKARDLPRRNLYKGGSIYK